MKPLVTVARFASVLPRLAKRRAACGAVLASLAGCGRLVGADFADLKPVPQDAGPPEAPAGGPPEICSTCTPPPSCSGLPPQCGPNADQDCCASYLVPGGTFDRDNNPTLPATVSRFSLDAYEVTVGRFRAFLGQYPGSKPLPGQGRHPKRGLATGWQEMWDLYMPPTAESMRMGLSQCDFPKGWTSESAANENLPIACVTWYVAFAFCAWDKGRLPTEAEWSFAAVGGAEQRVYPWSHPPDDEAIGPENGSFDCASRDECGSLFLSVLAVGTRPAGNSRWGHADLLGNLWEWTLDQQKRCAPCDCDACPACIDCTNPTPDDDHAYRIVHGGSFETLPGDLKLAQTRENYAASPGNFSYANDLGFRCARDPK